MDYNSFSDRTLELDSGFSLIWPFVNTKKKEGPFELFLDNNALINSSWLQQLPNDMKGKIIISPAHAFSEQWLSNEQFRNNPIEVIEQLIAPFMNEGIKFQNDYALKKVDLLKRNEAELKSQWMIGYLFVVLLYRIVTAKKGDNIPRELLCTLKNENVPRFNACIILCTIADYLKSHKGLKLCNENVSAFSYLSSFVSVQKGSKNETKVDEGYLRNRAGDLSMWMYLPMLYQHNYSFAGEPVVVTQDKALKKLIFRCIPCFQHSTKQMAFTLDHECFERKHLDLIWSKIQQNIEKPILSNERVEQLKKLENLKKYVLKKAGAELTSEVEKVWREWLVPGFFGEFKVD